MYFDIGANVGLYSIYYAARNKGKVYSFEPSVFNLTLLAKNINENNFQDKIRIISNPLSQNNQFSNFILSSIDEGGALSSFGVDYGYDGKLMKHLFSYQTLGFSLDFLLKNKVIEDYPSLIKIDVDGIEHLILAGAMEVLKNPSCRSVLVEINNSFAAQTESAKRILMDCGFNLIGKSQSNMVRISNYSDSFNQVWVKDCD